MTEVISTRLSDRQVALLRAVAADRIEWRDPHPRMSARTGRPGQPAWMVDGHEAYGGQIGTLDSLADRKLITAAEGEHAKITTAGESLLAAHDR